MIAGSAVWVLVRQSDAMTWLILIILLIMSIVCWAVALHKWLLIRQRQQEASILLDDLTRSVTVQDLAAVAARRAALAGSLIVIRASAMAQTLEKRPRGHGGMYDELNLVRDELDVAVNESVAEAEEYAVILKASAEISPLLGLLGTIWGLIHSFIRISNERTADIVTVAPGIAEALITTLMGLLVAIPALSLFHALYRKLQLYEAQLIVVAEQCERIIRRAMLSGESV